MTKAEFTQLIEYFGSVFPSFGNWFQRLPKRSATLAGWYEPFEQLELVDCQRVVPLMRDEAHGYAPLEAVSFERFPTVIPRYARKWRFDNAEAKLRVDKPHYEGAFTHVTERDATCVREFTRLMEAHEELAKEESAAGEMYRCSLPEQRNRMASERIGGVQL